MTLLILISNYRVKLWHLLLKKKEVKKDWYIINAENASVGRLASYISKMLRGKNKSTFNPHIDNGDFVIVTNTDKIKFTGKKFKNCCGALWKIISKNS